MDGAHQMFMFIVSSEESKRSKSSLSYRPGN